MDILKEIIELSYDFSSCNDMYIDTKSNRVNKAKIQEQIFIDVLKEKFPDYDILSCEEWCKNKTIKYSTAADSCYGDIVICKNNKTIFNIDLKVGQNDFLGTIDVLSLINFGKYEDEGQTYIYICMNNNATDKAIITHDKLYSIMKQDPTFYVSRNRKNTIRSPFVNTKIIGNNIDNKLYEEDYIISKVIKENKDY